MTTTREQGRLGLVATDLDGTLVRSDGSVSQETREMLAALHDRGVPVVFVTARPLRWMSHLWPLVGTHGSAICGNGAIWYDVPAQRVRHLWGIEPALGLILTDAIRTAVPSAAFAIEALGGIRYDERFVDAWEPEDGRPRGPLQQIWDEPISKLLAVAPDVDPMLLRQRVRDAVDGRAVVTWTGPELLEISAPGVTKATTLARVAAELEVAQGDVVAFGDMPNDIEMLTWAGRGYAMANADPDVIECADHLAPGNDDDGVARTLRDLLGWAHGRA